MFTFDLPTQTDFDEDDIRNMILSRRQLCTEWPDALHKPSNPESNWSVVLPFPNTYENAFLTMCETNAHAHHGKGRLCLFLNGTEGDADAPEEVTRWVETVGRPVAMKDFLALSFALDYDREGGDPAKPQTMIGNLRTQAKPYGGSAATSQTIAAAETLAKRCIDFLAQMTCYESADCAVAMPPSEPSKAYNLPRYLADRISALWGRENLTPHVRTIRPRPSIKGLAISKT
jgi:hypothetical protein